MFLIVFVAILLLKLLLYYYRVMVRLLMWRLFSMKEDPKGLGL